MNLPIATIATTRTERARCSAKPKYSNWQALKMDFDCPIESTHDKYEEAYYFLHRTLACYHSPMEFRFNLNAFIQASRNITFMLQSENDRPKEFDSWYANKRDEMKGIPLLKRFVDTRNMIVKQSMLVPRSTATIGVFRGYLEKLTFTFDVSPFRSTEDMLEFAKSNFIGWILDEEHTSIGEHIGIKRTWVVEELGEKEVTSICLEALSYMRNLLADAHSLFGSEHEPSPINIDTKRAQIILETDLDPSLLDKWNW